MYKLLDNDHTDATLSKLYVIVARILMQSLELIGYF